MEGLKQVHGYSLSIRDWGICYLQFLQIDTNVSLFSTEWILLISCLISMNILPEDIVTLAFHQIFNQGWSMFMLAPKDITKTPQYGVMVSQVKETNKIVKNPYLFVIIEKVVIDKFDCLCFPVLLCSGTTVKYVSRASTIRPGPYPE